MSVCQEVSSDGKKVQISITGRFDYKVSQAFRDSYRHVPSQDGVTYSVDLSGADYMDSSALGMLLLLREHAKSRGGTVYIERPSKQIDSILKVANFEQLFTINYAPSIPGKGGNVTEVVR
ncbi:MAG TPA: anti-sigma factor antagonist [Gammaproteobacteria bacterium]|nr:anti-sigma factor antagonist [Gammaproteobacteria bacterium]